jgi:hypothetical protein
MQVTQEISPLSCKGQWQKNFFDPNKDKNVAIKDLPYELMKEFLDEIKGNNRSLKNWETCIGLEFRRWKVKKKSATLNTFVQIMMKRNCKIQYLRNVASKLHDLSLEKCFYALGPNYMVHENARVQASQDGSRGYLRDISYETLKELAELLDVDISWKKMGDGLGFNLYECFHFSDPLEMLRKWITKFNDGTLQRIYFEVQRLGLKEVCVYLDGIPLEKISSMVVRDPHESHPELRLVTVFDLENFNKIDWVGVSHILFNSFSSKKDDLWLSGNVTLKRLKEVFNISLKYFEPKSYEGVTYNQVAFLAEAINSDSYMTDVRFSELINKKMSTCDFRIKRMSIRNSLCIYWQLNRELDLTQFFKKTLDVFNPTAPSTARILGCAYDLINPKRYYKGIT